MLELFRGRIKASFSQPFDSDIECFLIPDSIKHFQLMAKPKRELEFKTKASRTLLPSDKKRL